MYYFTPIITFLYIISIVLAMSANAAIIMGTLRFQKWRTPMKTFIGNWAIADLLALGLAAYDTLIKRYDRSIFDVSELYLCISLRAREICHLISIWFCTLISLDWWAIVCSNKLLEKFRRHYLTLIWVIWITVLPLHSLSAGLCLKHHSNYLFWHVYAVLTLYLLSFLFVIILWCYRMMQSCRAKLLDDPNTFKLRIRTITTIPCIYFIEEINTWVIHFNRSAPFTNTRLYVYAFIMMFTLIGSSVIILVSLWRLDSGFKSSLLQYRKTFKRKFKNVTSEHHKSNDRILTPFVYKNSV